MKTVPSPFRMRAVTMQMHWSIAPFSLQQLKRRRRLRDEHFEADKQQTLLLPKHLPLKRIKNVSTAT